MAYQSVAERLRAAIVSGRLKPGDRLPSEADLCDEQGVSRSTVREALRMLTSERLVATTRGVGGGTFVVAPQHDEVSELLANALALLTQSQGCSVQELLEAREQLEVPAAFFAAQRRDDEQLERIRGTIPTSTARISPTRVFAVNRAFHEAVLAASGNRLIHLLTAPVFSTLQTRFLRDRATPAFWKVVMRQHAAIADAIAAGDGTQAGQRMAEHLHSLRTTYERIDATSQRQR